MKIVDNVIYENGYTIITYTDGTVEKRLSVCVENPIIEEPSEPTQLDRIEEAINKSQQDIIDEYTLELIEGGII